MKSLDRAFQVAVRRNGNGVPEVVLVVALVVMGDARVLVDDLSALMDASLGQPRGNQAGLVAERASVEDAADLTDDPILPQRADALHHLVFRAAKYLGDPGI